MKQRAKSCDKCGFGDSDALVTHHKDGNPKNNSPENLQTLCANCHYIVHKKRFNNKWTSPIMKVLNEEGKIVRVVVRNNQTSGKVLVPFELIGKKVYLSLIKP